MFVFEKSCSVGVHLSVRLSRWGIAAFGRPALLTGLGPDLRECNSALLVFNLFYTGDKNKFALTKMGDAPTADLALIGLAVMGQNLILNMDDHGFVVCAYNRTTQKVDEFLANEAKGTKVLLGQDSNSNKLNISPLQIIGAHSLEEMVSKLKKPRRVMMLVKAGEAVDQFIDKLVPLLQPGDIIIDGGNSQYLDSNVSEFSFDFATKTGFSSFLYLIFCRFCSNIYTIFTASHARPTQEADLFHRYWCERWRDRCSIW